MGDRKHLIKSKLIFQQFELAEPCYNGTHRRILTQSLRKKEKKMSLGDENAFIGAVFKSKSHCFFLCSNVVYSPYQQTLLPIPWKFHLLKGDNVKWQNRFWGSIWISNEYYCHQMTWFTRRCEEVWGFFVFILVVVTHVQYVWSSEILLTALSAYVTPFSPLLSCQHISLSTAKQIPLQLMWFFTLNIKFMLVKITFLRLVFTVSYVTDLIIFIPLCFKSVRSSF